MSDRADQQIKITPINLRVTLQQDNHSVQVLPDGVMAAALHNQFIGNYQGLTELQRLLERREAELRDILKQQEQDKQNG